PEDSAEPLVSDGDARRAARELARLRRNDSSLVPSMLQSAWHVPVRWFVLFDDSERRLVETGPAEWGIRYWAPIESAAARAALARCSTEGRTSTPPLVGGVFARDMRWPSICPNCRMRQGGRSSHHPQT